jgi:hypothetical protein
MLSNILAQTNSISGFGSATILLDGVVCDWVIGVFAHGGTMASNEK